MSRVRSFRLLALFVLLLLVPARAPAFRLQAVGSASFDRTFTGKTMRVDYFHSGFCGGAPSGGAALAPSGSAALQGCHETFSLDRVVADGAWPGSRTRLLDTTNLGKYFVEVIDRETNQPVYSRGFASLYGEWETTGEAKETWRTFHESLRVPWPRRPVQVVLKKRDAANAFHEVWSTLVDPDSRFVNKADRAPAGRVWTLVENGPASEKVDLLVIGEGYTEAELAKFHADAKRLVGVLFETEPFKGRKADFNVRALDLPSPASGVHRPQAGVHRRTPISTEYNIFDTERYMLTHDNRTLRDVASAAPYEFVEILVNEQHYGGGGIYNFQATASVDSAFSAYVFVHEFGHHFAALADEYYTSDVAYETGAAEKPEPWEPNVTALHDAARLKWRDLVEAGTPIPTPWDKDAFEKMNRSFQARRRALRAKNAPEPEMDRLFREQQQAEAKLLASMTHSGKVGAFEGASYEVKGLYRPEADCIMFTRNAVPFCRVCNRAIQRIIDEYSRP